VGGPEQGRHALASSARPQCLQQVPGAFNGGLWKDPHTFRLQPTPFPPLTQHALPTPPQAELAHPAGDLKQAQQGIAVQEARQALAGIAATSMAEPGPTTVLTSASPQHGQHGPKLNVIELVLGGGYLDALRRP